MTKLISILLIVAAVFVGYRLYVYSEKFQDRKQTTAPQPVVGEQLPGMPGQLEEPLRAARENGTAALGKWLEAHGRQIQDPRLAWIQLDYCVDLIYRNPNEARRVFKLVQDRTATNSPVYPRIQEMEKTFQ